MCLGRGSTRCRASIHALLLVLVITVLGPQARVYGQEVAPSEGYELEYVEPDTGPREPTRKERLDQLRRCQVCPRDGVGFRFGIPIFVPLTAFRASGDGDENDDGVIQLEGKRRVIIPDLSLLMEETGDDTDGGPLI